MNSSDLGERTTIHIVDSRLTARDVVSCLKFTCRVSLLPNFFREQYYFFSKSGMGKIPPEDARNKHSGLGWGRPSLANMPVGRLPWLSVPSLPAAAALVASSSASSSQCHIVWSTSPLSIVAGSLSTSVSLCVSHCTTEYRSGSISDQASRTGHRALSADVCSPDTCLPREKKTNK